MKYYCILLIILFVSISSNYGQNFELRGLEIYNPAYYNPAFTATEKLIQTDLIGYEFHYSRGYWTNASINLPNTKSSLGFCIHGNKMFNSYFSAGSVESTEILRSNSFDLNYAYTHVYREEMKISGGLRLKQSIMHVNDTSTTLKSRYATALIAGVKFKYRNLYAGLDLGTGLVSRDIRLNAVDEPEVTWEMMRSFQSNFIAGYSLGFERRVNFNPVIGFQYIKSFENGVSDFAFYGGGNITILKTFGIGFSLGDMVSLSTNVKILDRVDIMVGIFQGGPLFDKNRIGGFSADYSLGFDPVEYIVQLRVKI